MACALREVEEESGILPQRLHFRGSHVDEAKFGCRYLLADCTLQEGDIGFDLAQRWKPPYEDPTDKDPILFARWAKLEEVLAGKWKFHEARLELLRQAVQL